MTVQVLKTYKKNQREIAEISARIIEKMENNPAFPNPPAALAALKKNCLNTRQPFKEQLAGALN